MNRRVLQICPHDVSPFGELCARYQKAADRIGVQMTTVFLGRAEIPRGSEVAPDFDYLDCDILADMKAVRAALTEYAGKPWDMVLCHRYRAYRAILHTPLAGNFCTVVAHEYGLMARWQRRMNRRILARNVRFAGVAPDVANEIRRGFDEALVLPNVLDVEQAECELLSKAEALAALGLAPGPFTVGVVGRLHYKKRPELALQAFQIFLAEQPDARLVFMGDGLERERLAGRRNPNVHVLGNIPQAPKFFRAFDALLHTALLEPFGMVVLEALYSGVPVVTLRQAGPEYVLGDLGVYAGEDTAPAFAHALQRAALIDRNVLLRAGRTRVEHYFSIPALAEHLELLLSR